MKRIVIARSPYYKVRLEKEIDNLYALADYTLDVGTKEWGRGKAISLYKKELRKLRNAIDRALEEA